MPLGRDQLLNQKWLSSTVVRLGKAHAFSELFSPYRRAQEVAINSKFKGLILGIACLIFWSCNFGSRSTESPVRGLMDGEFAKPGDEITQFSVQLIGRLSDGYRFLCTGTLIDINLILTAAHCLDELATNNSVSASFFVGEYAAHRSIKATKTAMYPGFLRKTATGDVGLIQLAEDAPEGYKPVRIDMTTDEYLLPMQKVLVVGNGGHDEEGNYGRLRSAWGVLDEARTDVGSVTMESPINTGDSGGPLLVLDQNGLVQIGVHSRVIMAGALSAPSFHSTLKYVSDWLKQKIQDNRDGKF